MGRNIEQTLVDAARETMVNVEAHVVVHVTEEVAVAFEVKTMQRTSE